VRQIAFGGVLADWSGDRVGNTRDEIDMANSSRREILQALAECIQEIESAGHRKDACALSLGIPALEKLLPQGRLSAGSVMELVSTADGTGAWTLALFMAKHACEKGKALIVVDDQGCFYPPAAARLGIDLARLIVLRSRKPRDVYAAVEQSLRSTAVGAVLGWFDRLPGVDGRRLQLAAETGGGLGLLLRPAASLRAPSFAAVRLQVAPLVLSAGSVLGAASVLGAGLLTPPLAGPKVSKSQMGDLRSVDWHGQETVPEHVWTARETVPEHVWTARETVPEHVWTVPEHVGDMSSASNRRVTVTVVRCHGGKSGQSLNLEIDDETGHVHLLPEMVPATPLRRPARASG
jgi:hypothetical protein